jgi:hypothetical protein
MILVETLSAWKNLMSCGEIPVGPLGIKTSTGEMDPTLALHGTVRDSILGFNFDTNSSVKIIATLPLIWGTRFLS